MRRMRWRVGLTLLAAVPVFATGCGLLGGDGPVSEKPEDSPRVERRFLVEPDAADPAGAGAAFTLLDTEKQAFNTGFAALPASAQPAAFDAFLGEYLDKVRAVDPAGVPEPVRKKFDEYLTACDGLRKAIKPLPDGYEKDTFKAGMGEMYAEHYDKAKFLGGNVVEAGTAVNKAFAAVFDAAGKNGLDVQK